MVVVVVIGVHLPLLDKGGAGVEEAIQFDRIPPLGNSRCRGWYVNPVRVRRDAGDAVVRVVMLSANADHPEGALIRIAETHLAALVERVRHSVESDRAP